jgi:hypothetical protein
MPQGFKADRQDGFYLFRDVGLRASRSMDIEYEFVTSRLPLDLPLPCYQGSLARFQRGRHICFEHLDHRLSPAQRKMQLDIMN